MRVSPKTLNEHLGEQLAMRVAPKTLPTLGAELAQRVSAELFWIEISIKESLFMM